jgi:predicted nucleic acid-binding Zn ribbon protein
MADATTSVTGERTGALAATPVPEPTHGCVRCGARIPIAESMCEACNPLGLKAPAASQAHGTVFLGIAIAVVIMAVVARMLVAGVGPFSSTVAGVTADPAGLLVTISVTNQGSSAGSTTCRIGDPTIRGIGPETMFVQSPVVAPGETMTFDAVVASLGTTPRPLSVDCDT